MGMMGMMGMLWGDGDGGVVRGWGGDFGVGNGGRLRCGGAAAIIA